MPIDTMMPVTPERVRARLLVWLSSVMMAKRSAPPSAEPDDHDQAEGPVVEDHVEQHER